MFWFLSHFFMFSYVTSTNTFLKPLSAKEEEKYLKKYFEGSKEAKDVLIERNLRLVAHISKKYSNFYDSEDLISIGTIGLIKGISTFNPEKATKLATYIARCIENEILMFLRSSKKHQGTLYLQEPMGYDFDGNEVCIEDKLFDEKENIEEKVETKIQIEFLLKKLDYVLEEKELYIIKKRYGIDTIEETQREIAKTMGISRSYVSRIEKKALKKLKKAMS